MKIKDFIGQHISSILNQSPFKQWSFERSFDDDLDELRIDYVFSNNSLSIICDEEENIRTIFLNVTDFDGIDLEFLGLPMIQTRNQVL